MNAHLKRLTNALSDTNPADLLERPASEEKGRASQFRAAAKPIPAAESDELHSADRQSVEKNKAAVDRCIKTGEVMSLLFPGGVHLKDGKDFATYRLFDALVGTVAHFAQTGMVQETALSAISRYATLLEHMIGPSEKP